MPCTAGPRAALGHGPKCVSRLVVAPPPSPGGRPLRRRARPTGRLGDDRRTRSSVVDREHSLDSGRRRAPPRRRGRRPPAACRLQRAVVRRRVPFSSNAPPSAWWDRSAGYVDASEVGARPFRQCRTSAYFSSVPLVPVSAKQLAGDRDSRALPNALAGATASEPRGAASAARTGSLAAPPGRAAATRAYRKPCLPFRRADAGSSRLSLPRAGSDTVSAWGSTSTTSRRRSSPRRRERWRGCSPP